MAGSGRVLQTGMRARPDDTRDLRFVLTDGQDEESCFDSIDLDPDGPFPPNGVVITWHGSSAIWKLGDGMPVAATKIGMSYDSGISGTR